MSWSKVSCGFDVEEETRNFGTRAVGLGQEAVFESTTLAVIESHDENENAKLRSLFKTHPLAGFAVVLDSSLNVFGPNFSQLLMTFEFGNFIEEVEWSKDGSFLYIGLQGGSLVAVHVPTETLFKISSVLDTSGVYENRKFFATIKLFCNGTGLELIVVTSSRKIIRIHGLCVKNLVEICCSSQTLSEKRAALSSIITSSLKFDILCSPVFCSSEAVVAESSACDSLIIVHNNTIEHWIMADGCLNLINSAPFEEVGEIVQASIADQRFVVLRLLSGELLFADMYTLEPCLRKDISVHDFSLVYFGKEDVKILLHEKNESSSFNLCCYTYPDFSLYFKLSNISKSTLPVGLHDCIYYMEFFGDEIIESVKVKTIVESDPKARLERLLLRGKFEEAEEFCRCFNFSMAEIYKCKAKKIADDISMWKQGFFGESQLTSTENSTNVQSPKDVSNLFQSLISILDNIEDVKFVVDLCIMSVPCKLEFVEKLLQYAVLRLDKIDQMESDNIVYVEKVMDLVKLFRTFTELQSISQTPHSWATFASADFFKDIQNYISKGDIQSAVVLCRGYWNEIAKGLTPTSALPLLELLPFTIPRSDLFQWLNTYVPLYLSLHDDAFQFFTQWVANTINVISCVEDDMELCLELIELLHSILIKTYSQSPYLPYCFSSLADYLIETIKILKKLVYLKREHGVKVQFKRMPTSHSKEEKTDLVLSILERVHYDDVEMLIKHFIKPYCSDNYLRCDEILLQHLTRLEAGGFTMNLKIHGEEVWEATCIKFTEFIHNQSEKMKAIVCILKNASVPWSETISEFANTWYKKSNSSQREEIDDAKKVATIQTLLLKYGVPQCELNDNSCEFTNIILFIIEKCTFENPRDLYNDIKSLEKMINCDITVFQSYSHFLCQSLSSGCTTEVIDILEQELSESDLTIVYRICADQLISLSVGWIYDPDYKRENLEVLFSKIIYALPAKKLPLNFMDIVRDLKVNYNVEVKVDDMKNCRSRKNIISKCINKLLSCDRYKDDILNTNYMQAVRDESVKLDIPFWQGCLELTSKAINADKLDVVTECIKCLTDENIDGIIPADKIYDIVFQLLHLKVIDIDRSLLKQLSSLVKTISFKGVSAVSYDFINKMSVCNIVLDLYQRDEMVHMKPVWYNQSVFVDVLSYQPDISRSQLSTLINLLSESYTREENDIKDFQMELLNRLPNCLHSADIALRILIAFERLYPQHFSNIIMCEPQGNRIIKMISDTLLKNVYSNSFNVIVALSLLFYFPQESALRWIDNVSFKTDKFRLHNLAFLAQIYCGLCKLDSSYSIDYSQIITISNWDRQFKQYGISFENIYADDSVKINAVKSLMKLPNFNCALLRLFCDSFGCSYYDYLFKYLSDILISWKLDYSIEDDELVIKSKTEDLYNTCLDIAKHLEESQESQLYSFITKHLRDKINPYYYEVYSVLINFFKHIERNDVTEEFEKQEMLLNFLFSYKRIGPVGKKELEMWDHEDGQQLAELQNLSKFRLPFKSTDLPADLCNFIGPELSLDNYKQWLLLPSWMNHHLNPDLICIITIKNLQRQIPNSQEGWELQLKCQDFLTKINECCGRIENFEHAWKTLYWAVHNTLPPGADQVEAAQHCLFKAREWSDKEDCSKSRAACMKTEMKYSALKIMHHLHKNNLAKPEFLNLSSQPVELLRALYADSFIAEKKVSNAGINIAASMIANDFNIMHELTDIKKEFLMKWLTDGSCLTDDNVDFKMEKARCYQDLERVVYMLKDEDGRVFNNILVQSILMQDENAKPAQMKLRALQILLSIMPHQKLRACTGKTTEELMNCLKTYQFVFDLEQVGICYSVTEFEKMPKDKVISYVLRNPTKLNCVIAAEMAITYNVNSSNVWNKILSVFITNNLCQQLEIYLVKIAKWSRSLVDTNILVNAWNTVIKLKCRMSEGDEKSTTIEWTAFLLNCPVLDKIDLSYMENNLKQKINFLKNNTASA